MSKIMTIWLSSFMLNPQPYDLSKSFVDVSLVMSVPDVIMVHLLVPAKNMKELSGWTDKGAQKNRVKFRRRG